MLQDCPIEAGPTGVLPRSHTSGQSPPLDRMNDDTLEWDGQPAVPLIVNAGDVALFVSDIWHRRLPSRTGDPGRYFLQCHYGRRDIAQRLRPTAVANQLSEEAIARAESKRDKTLIGLHKPFFYDG
jgi:ectoine hydroxylase-related dioxygenase (phytanoyl-CoA dioxygenase family)